jgi:tripartite-type tricarboxylate transporter receptor subunit TctC
MLVQLEIARAVNKPEVRDLLFNGGVESNGSTPEEFAAFVKADTARMGKVIREAGIRE